MKNWFKLFLIVALFQSSSCAYFFNSKEVELSIASNPPGADIIIEGRNYGTTPKMLIIEPKDYDIVLNIPNYGSTNVKVSTWQTVRDRNRDGERCVADGLGFMFILPLFSVWSVYCRDFKEKNLFVNIPQNNTNLTMPLPNDFYEINKTFQQQQNHNLPWQVDYRQNLGQDLNQNLDNYQQNEIGLFNKSLNQTTNNRLNSRNLQQTYDPFADENLQYPYQAQYRYNSEAVGRVNVAPQRNYIERNSNGIGENLYRKNYEDAPQLQKFPGKIQEAQPYQSYENLDSQRRSIEELYLEDMKKNLY